MNSSRRRRWEGKYQQQMEENQTTSASRVLSCFFLKDIRTCKIQEHTRTLSTPPPPPLPRLFIRSSLSCSFTRTNNTSRRLYLGRSRAPLSHEKAYFCWMLLVLFCRSHCCCCQMLLLFFYLHFLLPSSSCSFELFIGVVIGSCIVSLFVLFDFSFYVPCSLRELIVFILSTRAYRAYGRLRLIRPHYYDYYPLIVSPVSRFSTSLVVRDQ